jgi:hypothetical protein
MAIDGRSASSLLSHIGNQNAKGEYYLADLVALTRAQGRVARVVVADEHEVLGVNDRRQLARAEGIAQVRLRDQAISNGVAMIAPETVFLFSRYKNCVAMSPWDPMSSSAPASRLQMALLYMRFAILRAFKSALAQSLVHLPG